MAGRSTKKGSQRVRVSLACDDCKTRNYQTSKRLDGALALKKFCKSCGHHTMHRETK